jgi:hypothetical protein
MLLIFCISMGNLSTTALSRTILLFTTILISENIEQHSYVCVYLSVYFSKLNPLNNFNRHVKANLKEKCFFFLQEETLISRIGDACNKNPFE